MGVYCKLMRQQFPLFKGCENMGEEMADYEGLIVQQSTQIR